MTTKSYDVLCDLSLANGIRERGAMNCDPNLILTLTLILLLTLIPTRPRPEGAAGEPRRQRVGPSARNSASRGIFERVHPATQGQGGGAQAERPSMDPGHSCVF